MPHGRLDWNWQHHCKIPPLAKADLIQAIRYDEKVLTMVSPNDSWKDYVTSRITMMKQDLIKDG